MPSSNSSFIASVKPLLGRREYLTGIAVLHPDPATVALARNEFARYDEQQISCVDHMTSVLADEATVHTRWKGKLTGVLDDGEHNSFTANEDGTFTLEVVDPAWFAVLQSEQPERWSLVARVVTGLNVLLLLGLGYVWGRNYVEFRSKHTLGLFVFAGLLLARNCWRVYIYQFDPILAAWFASEAVPDIAWHTMLLHVFEFLALVFLAWITWD